MFEKLNLHEEHPIMKAFEKEWIDSMIDLTNLNGYIDTLDYDISVTTEEGGIELKAPELSRAERGYLKILLSFIRYKDMSTYDDIENFDKINLLIIEFHDLQKNLNKIKNFITKTRLKNIHINANNYGMVDKFGIPQVIEMTLINPKKFKIKNKKTSRIYPIKGLDFKNRKKGKEINITFG